MPVPATVSQAVYRRDGWHCRHCNNSNGLDPHHVIFAGQGGPETLDNLITLCRRCHDMIHAGELRVEIVKVIPGVDIIVRFWPVEKKKAKWKEGNANPGATLRLQ